MKLVVFVFIKFILIMGLSAQKIKIEIGDKFPFEDVFGWKGKNVVIEFFSSSCTSCFRALPKLDSLNDQYKGRVGFQLVGRKDKFIEKLYTLYEKKFNLNLPVLYDSVYFAQLEIEAVPYIVWVNDLGIVKGISHGSLLTATNLNKFLSGKEIREQLLGDKFGKEPFDNSKFYQKERKIQESKFIRKSVLTFHSPEQKIRRPSNIYQNALANKFEVVGASFQHLLNYAYFGYSDWDSNNQLYLTAYRRPILIKPFINLDSLMKLSFCYSLEKETRDLNSFEIQASLQHDLSQGFGVYIHEETQKVPVWRLIIDSTLKESLRSRGGVKKIATRPSELEFINVKIVDLINFIDFRTAVEMPIIDGTDIDYNIDIKFEAILDDFDDVRAAIGKLGLHLVEDRRLMKVLVIYPKL